jgi:hypothetical protein
MWMPRQLLVAERQFVVLHPHMHCYTASINQSNMSDTSAIITVFLIIKQQHSSDHRGNVWQYTLLRSNIQQVIERMFANTPHTS